MQPFREFSAPCIGSVIEHVQETKAPTLKEQCQTSDRIIRDALENSALPMDELLSALKASGWVLSEERKYANDYRKKLPANHILKDLSVDCFEVFMSYGTQYFNDLIIAAEEHLKAGKSFTRFDRDWANAVIKTNNVARREASKKLSAPAETTSSQIRRLSDRLDLALEQKEKAENERDELKEMVQALLNELDQFKSMEAI